MIDPFVEEFCGISLRQREPDTPVGGRIVRHVTKTVDEDVPVDLDAPGHGSVGVSG